MKTFGTHDYYVYILTNGSKRVLYIGFTGNLIQRLYVHNHPERFSKAFTAQYKCFHLIYYEHFTDVYTAIAREKQLKGWTRAKKIALINSFNPTWQFLNDNFSSQF